MGVKTHMHRPIMLICVDDEAGNLRAYSRLFRDASQFEVLCFDSPTKLDPEIAMCADVIISDQRMPDMQGTDFLRYLSERGVEAKKIICSAYSDFDDITEAFNKQHIDFFVSKPWVNDELKQLVINSVRGYLQPEKDHQPGSVIEKAYSLGTKAAQTDVSVYIQGETGTGKELLARYIHDKSPRANQPFIAVNCATLTTSLFESLLFGHKKGAFTGATESQQGFFEAANGGTLFLDEVVDIPLDSQSKILRALQERCIVRLGETHSREVDIRIISASAKPMESQVAEGEFRDDLMFRLNVYPISLPALRERGQDIIDLFLQFLAQYNIQHEWEAIDVDEEVIAFLRQYHWPGNVRELENLCNYLCTVIEEPSISLADLPDRMKKTSKQTDDVGSTVVSQVVIEPDSPEPRSTLVGKLEDSEILEALHKFNNNKTQAAKFLGVSRMTLWRRMQQISGQ